MKISVFGNPNLPEDSLALKLVPYLKKMMPEAEFIHQDPQEQIIPPAESIWWIIDVVKNLDQVCLITDLDKIKDQRRFSLHDYDLATELKLIKKINPELSLRIIGIPSQGDIKLLAKKVVAILTN